MKFLFWTIKIDPYLLAKIQWFCYDIFGIRAKNPCGYIKKMNAHYCHQPLDMKYCKIINKKNEHKIVCRCCGQTRKTSSHYIDTF